jgi:hypothetical protein
MFEIDSFYLIALSVATGILIIALGFMGWMLSHQKDEIKFPGITTTCPDFWAISEDGLKCELPPPNNFNRGTVKSDIIDKDGKRINNIFDAYKKRGTTVWAIVPGKSASTVTGQHTANSFDSKDAGWGSGNDAICNKRKWAKDNKINWDTVTNTNFC